mgnify:CR=1 FL=1
MRFFSLFILLTFLGCLLSCSESKFEQQSVKRPKALKMKNHKHIPTHAKEDYLDQKVAEPVVISEPNDIVEEPDSDNGADSDNEKDKPEIVHQVSSPNTKSSSLLP